MAFAAPTQPGAPVRLAAATAAPSSTAHRPRCANAAAAAWQRQAGPQRPRVRPLEILPERDAISEAPSCPRLAKARAARAMARPFPVPGLQPPKAAPGEEDPACTPASGATVAGGVGAGKEAQEPGGCQAAGPITEGGETPAAEGEGSGRA